MPELPELQAHAERLAARFSGVTLESFRALSFTALKTAIPSPDAAYGHALRSVERRGKYLMLDFGDIMFVVHLMQGGRLRPEDVPAKKPRGGLARWSFASEGHLLLTEQGSEKRAGVWVTGREPGRGEPLDHLGPDADRVDVAQLADLVAASSMRLHGWLRDQRRLAGVGRRLANEICHRARISPFANTGRLTGDEVERLHTAIRSCVDESLTFERSRDDMSSSKERPGAVHHRDGEDCPVCGDVVRTVEYARYTVAYCATCQTGGKVLADNTTSRFLK